MNKNRDEELPPSKLGTKDYWDSVYDRENNVFEDVGDEGEVWFGESSITKMRQWAQDNLPCTSSLPPLSSSDSSSSSRPLKILECGSGNGTLLLSFLTSPISSASTPPSPQKFHLTGIDYSEGSTRLSRSIEKHRREVLEEEGVDEEEEIINDCEVEWMTGDLLRDDFLDIRRNSSEVKKTNGLSKGDDDDSTDEAEERRWDLVLDKGTYDALCLSQEKVIEKGDRLPSSVYPEQIADLVKIGGYFLITSCNFTEEEIKNRWTKEGLGLEYHSSVAHKSFTFGGKSGTVVCTVAFRKSSPTITWDHQPRCATGTSSSGLPIVNGTASRNDQQDSDRLCICIDCGGTKTEVVIASEAGILARAVGGTGNMAEIGAQACCDIVQQTVMKAVSLLRSDILAQNTKNICPVEFQDIWIGISGCDTPLDQTTMSDLLSPFFNRSSVPILNDAHLLGGPLLSNHNPWGVAVIAGTGSVVVGLQNDGGEIKQIGRRGGFGYLLGDDGSAFDIGRSGIRWAVELYDTGDEPESGGLAEDMRKHFEVNETPEILAKVHALDSNLTPLDAMNMRKLQVSTLSRPILEYYSKSPADPLAVLAVEEAAGKLVDSIRSLLKQLQHQPTAPSDDSEVRSRSSPTRELDKAAIVFGGGVARQKQYRDTIVRLLADRGIRFGSVELVEDVAAEGALGLVEKGKSRKT